MVQPDVRYSALGHLFAGAPLQSVVARSGSVSKRCLAPLYDKRIY